MIKKINDERLLIRNLKNIRIAYIVQTLGIIAILAYDLITKGVDGMTNNPLWLVFLVTMVVSAYLSMSISVEYENRKKPVKKRIYDFTSCFNIAFNCIRGPYSFK